MDHIIDENGCWIYQGHCEKGSHDKREHAVYGRTSFKYLGKSQKIYMHRLSYAFYKGVDPSEMMVCHSCDQTRCLNPDHLFLGTASDNMKDAAEKGRLSGQKGSENANSILTDEDVYLIISLLGKLNNKQIAAALGNKVTYATIGMIRKGNAWSHLTGIKRPAA